MAAWYDFTAEQFEDHPWMALLLNFHPLLGNPGGWVQGLFAATSPFKLEKGTDSAEHICNKTNGKYGTK